MNPRPSLFKRPQWSLKSSFVFAVGLIGVVTTVILLVLKKSVWIELEIVALSLAPIMFIYMLVVLYEGVKFDKRERFSVDWRNRTSGLDSVNVIDLASSPVDIGFPFTEIGAEAGLLGIIIGLIIDVVVSIFLMALICFVMWFGVNVLPEAIVVIFFPLFYFYRRSLRYLVAKGRSCKGDWGKSIFHALISSVIYSTWLYLIIFAGHYVYKMWRTP